MKVKEGSTLRDRENCTSHAKPERPPGKANHMLNHHTENHLFRGEGQRPVSVALSSQPADARPPTEKILLQLVVGNGRREARIHQRR